MEENSSNILTEVRGNVGIITLNRPEVLNAVSLEMLNDISYQVQTWDYDENIRVMILQGNDKAFAAGIDVKELSFEISQQSFALKTWQEEFSKIANCSKPLVAAVSGYALGLGCDLALACDIILAAESARFAYPETSIGVIPAFGGCTRLVHTIGRAQTMELMLTGKALTAEEAAGRLEELYVRYRPSMLPAMLNLLDSHDTHRFLTLANGRIETLDAALAILFFYPGMPCLYYGTEIPMEGGYDPDCRRCFPWERANDENAHKKLLNSLILLRNSDVLAHGSFRAEEENGLLKITRSHNGKSLVLYVNGSRKAHPISSESLIASRYEGGYLEPFGFLIRR